MSSRRRAREIVLQLLYEADINGTREDVSTRRFIKSRLQGRKALTSFSEKLFFGTLEHRDQVDKHLGRLAKGWSLSRMAVTDRNVMRMAGYEILFAETPGRVAVNEAVVLIKRYGDKNSPRFVNGILDRLLKEHESGGLDSPESQVPGSLATEPLATEPLATEPLATEPLGPGSQPADQSADPSATDRATDELQSDLSGKGTREPAKPSVWPTRGPAQD